MQLSSKLSDFITFKRETTKASKTKLPDLMFFEPKDTFKDVVEKIILSQRNTLLWINENGNVEYTLGIS